MDRRKYQKLVVWQRAMQLVTEIYQLTDTFPDSEKFGLRSQLRRAAVSIPSNIAEGSGRSSDKDFVRFLSIATGSLQELETQLLIAEKLRYTDSAENLLELVDQIFAMLNNLKLKLAS